MYKYYYWFLDRVNCAAVVKSWVFFIRKKKKNLQMMEMLKKQCTMDYLVMMKEMFTGNEKLVGAAIESTLVKENSVEEEQSQKYQVKVEYLKETMEIEEKESKLSSSDLNKMDKNSDTSSN
mmetsp:Transcript_39421/g.41019  ORF Transcript_39421/g.41019 Transcript_39421/m.41019 type:complete len:121 (-) Transcript_39421:93-455(-)